MVPRQDPDQQNTTQKERCPPVCWRLKPYNIRYGSAIRPNLVVIISVSTPDGHEVRRNASSNRSWARLVRTYTDAYAHIRTYTDAYARIRTYTHEYAHARIDANIQIYTHMHASVHKSNYPPAPCGHHGCEDHSCSTVLQSCCTCHR